MLKFSPAVFAVGDEYQIFAAVSGECYCFVDVGGERFFDHSSGIMRREGDLHRVSVPCEVLNSAGEYTVFLRPVTVNGNRRETGALESHSFRFRAPKGDTLRVYNISDAHSRVKEPIAAAKAFGEIDALILCGDIMDLCNDMSEYMKFYEICGSITGGEIPVVSTRGNHDMRGLLADRFADYMPSKNGNIFYTFRLGNIWGVVLDCGEITPDDDENHGFAVCCDPFRHAQTEFLREVVATAEWEYAAEGICHKLVVVHDPFFEKHNPPYDVARDIMRDWFDLINENIKPDMWLCGHSHLCQVRFPGYSVDEFGITAPLVMASTPGNGTFKGGGFVFRPDEITLTFTDNLGNRDEEIKVK